MDQLKEKIGTDLMIRFAPIIPPVGDKNQLALFGSGFYG